MNVIVSCGKAKQRGPCQAGKMYTGSYSKGCLRWALSVTDWHNVFIMSAKYGLLPLSKIIAPYDITWGDVGCADVRTIKQQAQDMKIKSPVVMVGGSRYRKIAEQVWDVVHAPLIGIGGMGHQLAWLKNNRGRMPVQFVSGVSSEESEE